MEDKFEKLKTVVGKTHIAAIGMGANSVFGRIERLMVEEINNHIYNDVFDEISQSFKETSKETSERYISALEELSEIATDEEEIFLDISSLKKRIKYCKNPMEKKKLERELNASYKAQKRRK